MKVEIVDPLYVVVTNGAKLVHGTYPEARFLEADSQWSGDGAGKYDWRLVFSVVLGRGVGTVFAYCKDFQFAPLQLVHDVFLESNQVPLPLRMGLIEAARLATQAGFTGTITTVTVRWPETHPATTEPQYIFSVPSQGVYVYVGIDSKKVTSQPLRERPRQ